MKKAGIVTFHRAWNYGACLQAWASKVIFEQLGYEAELIDYVNEVEQSTKGTQPLSKIGIKNALIAWLKNLIWKKDRCVQRSFERDNGLYELNNGNKNATLQDCSFDILVAGSDQIWNPKITGGIDPIFFLDFGNAGKRISLASSIGSHQFSNAESAQLMEFLKRFDAISVRGRHAKDQIQPLTELEVKEVPDPTLLLERSVWRTCSKTTMCPKGPYILTYFVGTNFGNYRKKIEPYIREMNMPVYNIQFNTKRFNGSTPVTGATPVEMLGLIRNAEMVITDSFHGNVFSIVFERPFIAVENRSNPKRVQEFLRDLGLNNRIEPEVKKIKADIDFCSAHLILDQKRKDTLNWLRERL